MRWLRLISRLKRYVYRGHSTLGIFISMPSHIAVLWELFPGVKELFGGDFLLFLAAFLPIVAIGYIGFAYWDYLRGTYVHEQELIGTSDPKFQDIFYILQKMNENNPEVQELTEKWLVRRGQRVEREKPK